jgi:multidrug efflux pump subunit AcrA (membrane-fusion protein)
MSWMPRKLAVGMALLALCTGCSGLFGRSIEQELPTPTPIPTPIIPDEPTYSVQRGRVTKEQEFVGRISPVEEINLYFKRSGYVKQVLVKQGDMVRAGDLLAELEIDDLLGQAAQARMNLQSAELRLDAAEDALERQVAEAALVLEAAQIQLAELQQEPDPVQVELLRLAWERAKNTLWSAQAQRDSVMAQEDAPGYLRDQAQAAVANAEIAVQEAQLRHQQGRQPVASQYEVRLQQIAVKQAQQELDWLKAGVDPVLVNAVDQANLTLERLEACCLLPSLRAARRRPSSLQSSLLIRWPSKSAPFW